MSQLSVEVAGTVRRPLLVLSGELDIATADQLRQAGTSALSGSDGTLGLDLGRLAFIDSSGLGALVDLRNVARSHGGSLVLTSVSQPASRVIAMAGLAAILGLAPSDAGAGA